MSFLPVLNPWNVPLYYHETLSSTMDESRVRAARGAPHGTVVIADYQETGRGRAGRPWKAERGKNLFFTVLLRYPDISSFPEALTLRTGLAVSLAIEDYVPVLSGAVLVKWPNDIMIDSRKVAGILTETDGKTIYIGVGVNVAQDSFPGELGAKAGSILQAARARGNPELAGGRAALLERILARLYAELSSSSPWRGCLEDRLYLKGRQVRFIAGGVDSGRAVEGVLTGIGTRGELLIMSEGKTAPETYVTGELRVY